MDYLQAENQFKTFRERTGGYAWFPPLRRRNAGIYSARVAAFLRNQVTASLTLPAIAPRWKILRKVKIELVAPDGSPLLVTDQKVKKAEVRRVFPRRVQRALKAGTELSSPRASRPHSSFSRPLTIFQ